MHIYKTYYLINAETKISLGYTNIMGPTMIELTNNKLNEMFELGTITVKLQWIAEEEL